MFAKLFSGNSKMVRHFFLSIILIISTQVFGQSRAPGPLTAEEQARWNPPDAAIKDLVDYGQFTQNFLLANHEFLKSESEYLRGTHGTAARQELLALRAPIVADALMLLNRGRGTIGITQAQMLEVCEERPTDLLVSLIQRVDEAGQEEDCRNIPLQVGQTMRFNHRSRLQIPAYQVVKRLDQNRYEATLNLNVTDVANPENGPATLAKIRGCMELVAPALKGPENKSLRIRILTPEETAALPEAERPQQVNISVAPATEPRGHATNYLNSWKCDTITHEILHLLGLCDEYHENGGFVAEWSCRVVPRGNSIMASHHEFFPTVFQRVTRCACHNEVCRGATGLNLEYKKRYSASPAPCLSINAQEIDSAFRSGVTPGVTYANNVVTLVSELPPNTSLITDVHFKKIISGYCAREAPGYAQCSQYSQISSEDPRCRQIPFQCSDSAYYRGTVR
jgi:hypothetical protein